jgi:hypothetical protein
MSKPVTVEITGTPRMISDGPPMPTTFLLDENGKRWRDDVICGVSYSNEGALLDVYRECNRLLRGRDLEAAMQAMAPHMTEEILHRWD